MKAVCPAGMPAVTVRERKWNCGDFAFEATTTNNDESGRYSLVVERKRVGDLIRSSYGDHWNRVLNDENQKSQRHIHSTSTRSGSRAGQGSEGASYNLLETPVLCEMAFASLMIDHDMVVLQAV